MTAFRSLAGVSLLVLALPEIVHAQSAALATNAPQAADLDDIVVTATRRNETAISVPYNISAVDGTTLESARIVDLSGLRTLVPGLTAPDYGARANGRNNNFIIRGVNTDSVGGGASGIPKLQTSSVSTYIDETPIFTNLRLVDIDRVEVLRGPQGTLYGAGSVGGTIRLLLNKPDPSRFEYKVMGSLSGTDRSGGANWGIDGVVNIPLTSNLAFRASGGYSRTAGLIDATAAVALDANNEPVLADPGDPLNSGTVTRSRKDIDWSKTWYARASLLWAMSDDVTAQLSVHHQNDKSGGFTVQGLNDAPYTTSRPIPFEPSDRDTDFASLTLTADFGFATMTSATSYSEIKQQDTLDFTGTLLPFLALYGGFPRFTSPLFNDTKDRNFAQEIRLVSKGDGPFSWVVGGYYQKLKQNFLQDETVPGFAAWSELSGSDFSGAFPNFGDVVEFYNGGTRPSTLRPRDRVYTFDREVNFRDIAAFAELSYDLTDKWQVTVGGRMFWQRFKQNTLVEFPICGQFCADNSLGQTIAGGVRNDRDQIFKFNTSYKIADDLLAYGTISQGFRGGGANGYPIGNCVFCDPADFVNFGPDTADNYELGLKGKLGPKFRFSLAAYQIDWKNVQLESGSTSGNPIIVNGKSARSRGLEVDGTWRPTRNVTVTAGYAFVDAKITEAFSLVSGTVAIAGAKGARLPGVSKHQLTGAIDYEAAISPSAVMLFRIDGSYRSGITNQINENTNNFARIKGFALVNMSGGVELSSKLTLQAFVDNLWNVRGVTAVNRGQANAPAYQPIAFLSRPRTIGLRFTVQN